MKETLVFILIVALVLLFVLPIGCTRAINVCI
jgi:hypothetical protein